MLAEARYSDGRNAASHPVAIEVTGHNLLVRGADGVILDTWPTEAVRLLDGPDAGGRVRLCRHGAAARLATTNSEFIASMKLLFPNLRDSAYGDRRGWKRVALWTVGAIVSLALFFVVLLPLLSRQIAQIVPPQLEAKAGEWMADLVVRQLGSGPNPVCNEGRGAAALAKLTAKVAGNAQPGFPLRVRVINSTMVNAFALPGGQILVASGLLDFSTNPNWVAGVLAHEIAHAELRHPAEVAIARSGASYVIGLLFGDAVGFSVLGGLAQTLIGASYTREAESAADARAIELMRAARLDTGSMAAFFEKIEKRQSSASGLLAYFATHPPSPERAKAFSTRSGGGAALTAQEWSALQSICLTKK